MTRENVADILCIGAQRAMTTWLHQCLSAHPGTWAFPNFQPVTAHTKEAHYWDWNHHRGPDWYRVTMRPLDERLKSLDFTPEYAFLNEAQLTECQRLNPGARVIYILRDPLARAVSGVRMHTVWASKHAAAEDVRLEYDTHFLTRCKNARLWEHGAYARNLARWRRYYPDMLVLNYEDLRADPLAGLRRVLDHCGLAWDALSQATRETLTDRAGRRVWSTPAYTLSPDCLNFLHGAMWPLRDALKQETGITFTEGGALLEARQERPA
ncbi:sulfotransferase [Rhodobacter sp. NTK016B]|uniref:sulfotransferase family protein n=1 Tax=Rhodobacter sp. NTK016B TaxID=2759676 RepID=UPI001A8C7710|nr:sulfotransferase [Rhodobacter sp. NTK016B]MBN8293827.1 sulfotransferase [Rhodobacter sp. NTK016B]